MRKKVWVLLMVLILFALLIWLPKDEKSSGEFITEMLKVEEPTSKTTFNESKWKTKKGWDYPHRNSMVDDLISNEIIRKLKKEELLDRLGEPDRSNGNYWYYIIAKKRFTFWTLHQKTLVIKLSPESTITWMKLHE